MKTADIITWMADRLWQSGQASSKRAGAAIAESIVNELVDKGVLITDDATPTVLNPEAKDESRAVSL